jgi:hypothetical protein
MGIFDLFTGAPQKQAAAQTRQYLGGVKDDLTGMYKDTLTNNQDATRAWYGDARDSLSGGYNTGTGAINTGADSALSALGSGASDAQGYLSGASAAYNPLDALSSKYGGATTMALNSLGVNGQAGTDAARSAFQTGPAYDFNMTQGLDAINRRRNMGGMLDSGNADRDAQTFGAGLASNEYNTWMNNLLGFTNPEASVTGTAATGRAGIGTNQANIANTLGINQAGVEGQRGQMLSNLASQYGQGRANLATGQAGAEVANNNNYASGMSNAAMGIASPYAGTYKNEADAATAGSANLWNLGLQGAKLAMGGLGGMSGGGMGIPFGATPVGAVGFDGWQNPDYRR